MIKFTLWCVTQQHGLQTYSGFAKDKQEIEGFAIEVRTALENAKLNCSIGVSGAEAT